MKKLRLTIELVPSSSWQNNLRSVLKPKMWDEIRKKVYRSSNFKCAVCGKKGKLQAHEIWQFDDERKIQRLTDIIPLCFLCHMTKHIGFASLSGGKLQNERVIRHFMEVNKVDRTIFQKHFADVMKDFEDRSHYEWQLDLSKLKGFE